MKKILIVGAGEEQKIAIELAKRMGLFVIAVDGNPKAVGLRAADVGISVDIKDVDELVRVGRRYQVKGIFCHAVDIPVVIAKAAKALGLPGMDPEVADRATNKLKRISCFTRNGVPCPKFEVARTIKEAEKNAKTLGFPVVIKPIDNAGARGVVKIRNVAQLRSSFKETLSYSKKKTVLTEQYIAGRGISTESVVYGGKIYHTGFGDRNYSRNREFYPYFVEDGHSVPSTLSERDKKRVLKTVERAINALGITWGVAKGDIIINKDNAYVLEMAPRTSGGWFAAGTVPIATGVNIIRPLIKMSLGEPLDEGDVRPRFSKASCQRYVIPTKSGYFLGFSGIAEARRMTGVKMFVLFKKPKRGELIRKSTNHSERYGQLIAEGSNVPDAVRKCERAIRMIRIRLKAVA